MLKKLVIAALLGFSSLLLAADPVDINTADAAALEVLDGIGPAKAAAIIAYREKNGLFKSVDDLILVRGIGEKTLEALRPSLTVGAPATAAPAPAESAPAAPAADTPTPAE
ncbi:MAG: ComEA family DNA-binding protein [Gammaproteobacteria bacterium]